MRAVVMLGLVLALMGGRAMAGTQTHATVKIGGKRLSAKTHAIVIPAKPTVQEQHAAQDLQLTLRTITGEQIPVVTDAAAGSAIPIIVGKSELIGKLGASVGFASLGKEGLVIKTVGPALILAGNERGVLYAVYSFLQDSLGCRWFTPDCSVIPTSGTFTITKLDRRYVPPLEYRATDYPNSRDGDWAVRNKLNGSMTQVDAARGGKIDYRGFVHTFNSLVPPEKYFAEHPEYYSEIDGKRKGPEETQLCCTNPDVVRIATETVERWIEESPQAQVFSVSQNDWFNYCQCENCKALAEKEGSQIAPILHLVNSVADAVREKHPDKIIDTLAYQYGRKPAATMRPRPNVVVRLCSIECCFAHPLATDPKNASFVEDITGWSQMSDRLWIWDYVINYAHCLAPFPNLYVLKSNINFFIEHGVTGIYEESDYFTKGGEFAELRTYLMAQLLWDPSKDTDALIDEFLAAYYGAAAKPIREYITLLHTPTKEKPDLHVEIYTDPKDYLTVEEMTKAAALFARAEAAVANDATRLHRVQVAGLPVRYAQLVLEPDSPERTVRLDRFERIARAEGVTHISEWRSLDDWLQEMRSKGNPR